MHAGPRDDRWGYGPANSCNGCNNIWKHVAGHANEGISQNAHWIWTHDHDAHNDVFCRFKVHVAQGSSGTIPRIACGTTVTGTTINSEDTLGNPGGDVLYRFSVPSNQHNNLDQLPNAHVTLGTHVDTLTDRPLSGEECGTSYGCGFHGDADPDSVIDMSHSPDEWTISPTGDSADCSTRLYLTIDLGGVYPVGGVTLWHYYGDTRQYCGQKVALSTTGAFNGEEVVVLPVGARHE